MAVGAARYLRQVRHAENLEVMRQLAHFLPNSFRRHAADAGTIPEASDTNRRAGVGSWKKRISEHNQTTAIGTDTTGSVTYPSNMNSLAGLRPS